MRANSVNKILTDNKDKKNKLKKEEDIEALNKQKELDLESAKKAEKLKEEETFLIEKRINYLEEQKGKMIEDIKQIRNPVVVSFSGDEGLAGYKYVELKQRVDSLRSMMLESRANIVNFWYILFAKLSGTLFFIFILVRLAGENKDLIASFTYITVFQNIFGESDMTLFIDFFLQDVPLVSAISFLIAIGFKDYENFFENKTRSNLYKLFGISIVGLFVSSMLFAY